MMMKSIIETITRPRLHPCLVDRIARTIVMMMIQIWKQVQQISWEKRQKGMFCLPLPFARTNHRKSARIGKREDDIEEELERIAEEKRRKKKERRSWDRCIPFCNIFLFLELVQQPLSFPFMRLIFWTLPRDPFSLLFLEWQVAQKYVCGPL